MTIVELRYSEIFDEQIRQYWLSDRKKAKGYPSVRKIKSLLISRIRLWKKHERRIIVALERTTGCPFREKQIVCYVIGRGVPISDPLVLPLFVHHPSTRFIDSLTHELIHRIFLQSDGQRFLQRVSRPLKRQYPNESWNVILHVVVHAVLAKLYLDLFTSARIQDDYNFVSALPEYKRAWDIVCELTPEQILTKAQK